MNLLEIKEMINIAKKVDISSIHSDNEVVSKNIKAIYAFVQTLEINYCELLQKLNSSNVRFCDYYECSQFHGDSIIEYFKESYKGEDLDDLSEVFSLYVALKNIRDLVYNFELCDTLDELYEILDNGSYFSDIMHMIKFIDKKKKSKENEEESKLEFLDNDNKYKILFTGFSYKDITSLEKNIKKAFINKISGQLCKSEIVTLTECVDHVKDLYDFPLFRVQFANDYRIAYIRKNDVTAIVGVTIKSGKDIDYKRYDAIAKNANYIYKEIELLNEGKLPEDSDHYRTVEYLEKFNEKTRK